MICERCGLPGATANPRGRGKRYHYSYMECERLKRESVKETRMNEEKVKQAKKRIEAAERELEEAKRELDEATQRAFDPARIGLERMDEAEMAVTYKDDAGREWYLLHITKEGIRRSVSIDREGAVPILRDEKRKDKLHIIS